ncbi:MAG: hypothetical protein LBP33_11045, partial [Candidatus Adiutrix sp.]|nr:hypothetical protein [Candidatus Adiutrix sp.]
MFRPYSTVIFLFIWLMPAWPASLMAQSGALHSPAALRDLLMAAERVTLAENEMYVYQKGGASTVVLEIRQTVGELLQARPNKDFRHRFVDLGTI